MSMRPISRALAVGLAVALLCGACAGYYVDFGYEPVIGLVAEDARDPNAAAIVAPEPFGVAAAAAYAIANDATLASDREALDLREGSWRLGLRSFLPSIEFSAGADEALEAVGAESRARSLSASLEQPLWDGGRMAARRALEAVELELARFELDRTAYEIGEKAVASYRAVMAARARLAIQSMALGSARLSRSALAAELALGLASASELLEADLEIGEAEIAMSEAELDLRVQEGDLAYALGVDELPPLSDDGLGLRPELRLVVDELWPRVVALSPELEAARYGVVAKRAEARAAALAWLPAMRLTGSCYLSGDGFPLGSLSWSVGASVEFASPLANVGMGLEAGSDGPGDRSASDSLSLEPAPDPAGIFDVRNARLALRVEEEAYAATMRELRDRTVAAARAYENALARRRLYQDAERLALARLVSIELRRELGQATTLEAIRAGLERAGAEIDVLGACAAIVDAERAVERLLGLTPDTLRAFVEAL